MIYMRITWGLKTQVHAYHLRYSSGRKVTSSRPERPCLFVVEREMFNPQTRRNEQVNK